MQASSKFKVKRAALLAAVTILAACIQAALIAAAREPAADAACALDGMVQRPDVDLVAPATVITAGRLDAGLRSNGK